MSNPKLFVSYCWTSPEHEEWVLRLATELVESGVDAILDKWHLREGHDANAFMEKMVTDPEIKKVIMVCDKAYAEKANRRSGGVGTEAQIISGEIYQSQDQEKFVAVVKEYDPAGKAYVPAYYHSRIYIDLGDPTRYAENFEQLLRWIYGRPVNVRPPIGSPPAFLVEESALTFATSGHFRRAIDAIKSGRPQAMATAKEYLQVFTTEMGKLKIDPEADPFDDAVMESIESFTPYRNEMIEFFATLALYSRDDELAPMVHGFFERMIPLIGLSDHGREILTDNFKFVVHELFLYANAIFIREGRFEVAAHLMEREYYVAGRSDYGRDVMVPYVIFRRYVESLEERRKRRLSLNRVSVHADLLKDRCKGIAVDFQHVLQADFILFLRSWLADGKYGEQWYPVSLLYLDRSVALEVFARSRSKSFFDRSKVLLGVEEKEELRPTLEFFEAHRDVLPRWNFHTINPKNLIGFDQLSTKR